MSDDRKTPLWPMIAALLIALPVLYVASFGPACWLTSQRYGWSVLQPHRAMIIYYPLGALAADPGTIYGRSLRWWMTLAVPRAYAAVVPTNAKGTKSIEVGVPP